MTVPKNGEPEDVGSSEGSVENAPAKERQKKKWVAPRFEIFGPVSTLTAGVSYNPLDGISNLTP